MSRLLQAEFMKLFKTKVFHILSLCAFLIATFVIFMGCIFFDMVMEEAMSQMTVEQQELVWQQMSATNEENVKMNGVGMNLTPTSPSGMTPIEIFYSSFGSGIVEIFIGILVAAFVAKEYSAGTLKNILAYGKKRSHLYLSKFVVIVVGIVILVALLTITPTIGCFLLKGWGGPFAWTQIFEMLSTFIAAIITYSATAAIVMIIATLLKSNGGTIGATIGVFVLLPSFSYFLYGKYTWLDQIYELMPNFNSLLAVSRNATGADLFRIIIIALVTSIICLFSGIHLFKAQDIK